MKQLVCEGKPDADVLKYLLRTVFGLEERHFSGRNVNQQREQFMFEKIGLRLKLFHAFTDQDRDDSIVYHPEDPGESGVMKTLRNVRFQDPLQANGTVLCGAIDLDDRTIIQVIETIRSAVQGEEIPGKTYSFLSAPFTVVALPIGIPGLQIGEITFKRPAMDDLVLNAAWNNTKYQRLIQNSIEMFNKKADRDPVQKELIAMISAFVDHDYKNVLGLIRELFEPLSRDELMPLVLCHMLDSLTEFLDA